MCYAFYMSKEQIKDRYTEKILAVRNYASEQRVFGVQDFVNTTTLETVLEEVSDGESDITPAGKAFLDQYFGIENVAQMMLERGFLDKSTADSVPLVAEWLRALEPMEVVSFVERARSEDVLQGESIVLQEKFLPPAS